MSAIFELNPIHMQKHMAIAYRSESRHQSMKADETIERLHSDKYQRSIGNRAPNRKIATPVASKKARDRVDGRL